MAHLTHEGVLAPKETGVVDDKLLRNDKIC